MPRSCPPIYRKAGERLSLLYLQSGRPSQAKKGLEYLGFTCRLAEHVLNYYQPTNSKSAAAGVVSKNKKTKRRHHKASSSLSSNNAPCVILDDFLHPREYHHLQHILQDPASSYWTSHHYQVEPPSPYFSYVMDLRQHHHPSNTGPVFLMDLARQIQGMTCLLTKFPHLAHAHKVEVWAHNRPHASGHQLHFDSDDEGRGGVIKNPVCSTILYLNDDDEDPRHHSSPTTPTTTTSFVGGPSLITNQRLTSNHLATRGWLAYPKPRRLVVFDGRVLHGVIPGKGVFATATTSPAAATAAAGEGPSPPPQRQRRRVTLMFAFWKEIQIRTTEESSTPGSARPFPNNNNNNSPLSSWVQDFSKPDIVVKSHRPKTCQIANPLELSHVYETLDGEPWKPSMGMPEYEQVFQGF